MISGKINSKNSAIGKITAGSGTSDHARLINRDLEDQHPISAISDLQETLDEKLDRATALPLIEEAVKYKAKGLYYDALKELASKAYWYLTSEIDPITKQGTKASIISGPYDLGQGGGGGGGVTVVTVKNTDPETGLLLWPSTVAFGGECRPKIYWTSTKDSVPTGNGTMSVILNDVQISTKTVPQGYVTLDLDKYIISGNNTLQVKIMDSYGTSGVIIGNINAISIGITSKFNYIPPFKDVVRYIYTPIGEIEKTVYFYVDNSLYTTQIVKSSMEQQSLQIEGLSHGSHSLRVYLTANIDGEIIKSEELYYDLIVYKDGKDSPIIASQFNELEQTQYISFNIPYRVYTPGRNTSNVNLYVDDMLEKSLVVGQTEQYWEYSNNTPGNYELKIVSGSAVKKFNVHIKESEVPVRPVTQDLVLALSTLGRSNSEPEDERIKWEDKERAISCTLENFNFSSNGWLKDSENNTILRVSGDARVTIPYKPFENDLRSTGKTIELEIATSIVRDYETKIISCFDGNRGFYITPQLAKVKSQLSELQTQYKEDDHVRITFVIEDTASNRIMYMYINGVMSGAIQYPIDDNFRQLDPKIISIGTNDATVDIYNIRIYDNGLTRKQVVNNWIADTQNESLKSARFSHNNIFNDLGEIAISQLPKDLPYIIWDIDPLPQYKGDKRKGQANFVDQANPNKSFTLAAQGDYNTQGTSSAIYPVKNIRLKSKAGFIDNNGDLWSNFTIKGKELDDPEYIGANYFTFKVDYASSEGANNVELVRLYNDASKAYGILTPPQIKDTRVRVGIDGFPIAAFHKNALQKISFTTKANFNNDKANENVYGFEDGDESWEINNNSADEAKFKVANIDEIDHYDDKGEPVYKWEAAFEIRFPDIDGYGKKPEEIAKLKDVVNWVASTYRANATSNPISPVTYKYTEVIRAEDGTYSTRDVEKYFDHDTPEYRLTKFKAELKDHFNVESSIFYYIFTHLYLMVDSRAKNAFPSYFATRTGVQKEDGSYTDGGNRWFWLPYDMDTAIGINNEGKLVFDYSLEDTDTIGGSDVFNGQDSVMWCNLRDAFDGEITKMYSELRTSGSLLSFSNTENRFQEHQSKWPENLLNEDSYVKYIKVLASTGENYLEMLQGSKAEQRRWWLYNRFKYFDSMYNAGDALADHILFRAYVPEGIEKPNIEITPYADVYATASFANAAGKGAHKRAFRNEITVLENPFKKEEAETDQETHIYPASQIKSIGDISGFYPDTVKVANATKLQDLRVGSGKEGYVNNNLRQLELGANIMLKVLDARNCPNLTSPITVDKCINIEEIYLTGTSSTGVILPDGGALRVLHLPETITLLKIKNQNELSELVLAGTSNLESLWLENLAKPIFVENYKRILNEMKTGGQVRLIGIDDEMSVSEVKALYSRLDQMEGISEAGTSTKKAQVSGKIKILNSMSYEDYVELQTQYPEIVLSPEQIICTVNFWKYKDIPGSDEFEIYRTLTTISGSKLPDVVVPPQRVSSISTVYTFKNWYLWNGTQKQIFDPIQDIISTNLEIYPDYLESTRQYLVKFDKNTGIEEIKVDPEKIKVDYLSTIDRPIVTGIPEGLELKDWHPNYSEIPWKFNDEENPSKVTGDVILLAHWNDSEGPEITFEQLTCNTYKAICEDDVGVTGYQITHSEDIPETWEPIDPPEIRFEIEKSITTSEDYYFWAKDNFGPFSRYSYKVIKGIGISKILNVGVTSIDILYKNSKGEYEIVDTSAVFKDSIIKISGKLDSHYENLVIKLNSENVDPDKEYIISEDVEIEASCTPKTYEVIFDTLGKGVVPKTQFIVYKNKVIAPNPQHFEGEIIEGWYTSNVFDPSNKWDFENSVVEDNLTLYANWIAYKEPTVISINIPEDNYELIVHYTQNTVQGVEIDWGDGSEKSSSSVAGIDNMIEVSHTYALSGAYEVKFQCNKGIYLFGFNIENTAFEPASVITNIDFAWDVSSFNKYAFANAENLTKLVLTDYISSISEGCFQNCTSLSEIQFSQNLLEISSSAFSKCASLSGELILPSKLKVLGASAFIACKQISKVVLPESLTEIGGQVFAECSSLEEINIPKNINAIPEHMLRATSVTKLDIPENILSLGTLCFAACSNLNKVILRNKDLAIDDLGLCFNYCELLKTAGPIGGDYNIEFAWDLKIPAHAFESGWGESFLLEIVLPQTIKEIGDRAFYNCLVLQYINKNDEQGISYLPSELLIIGKQAFANCNNLFNIDIPITTINVGANAFGWCHGLQKVYFHPGSVLDESKPKKSEDAWFYYSRLAAELHIPEVIDSETAKIVYGSHWNYYDESRELVVYSDLL